MESKERRWNKERGERVSLNFCSLSFSPLVFFFKLCFYAMESKKELKLRKVENQCRWFWFLYLYYLLSVSLVKLYLIRWKVRKKWSKKSRELLSIIWGSLSFFPSFSIFIQALFHATESNGRDELRKVENWCPEVWPLSVLFSPLSKIPSSLFFSKPNFFYAMETQVTETKLDKWRINVTWFGSYIFFLFRLSVKSFLLHLQALLCEGVRGAFL